MTDRASRSTCFMMLSIWIERARWWMKQISTPTLATASASDPDTASRGTNASCPAPWTPTVYSPAVE
jgi:hypothetical protein